MNLAHVHLLLNHFPTIGTITALGLFLLAVVTRSEDLKRASLAVFAGIALIAMPTYMSGNAAQEMITGRDGISDALIEAHQSIALPAYILIEFLGLAAWYGLWQYRRKGELAKWIAPAVLILGIASFALMARAAAVGGEISHPEIHPANVEGSLDAAIDLFRGSAIKEYVLQRPFLWAGAETLHFIGLSMLFGVVLLIDLRMMGVVKNVSFAALHQLLPWAVLGFAINTATGMLFFVAASDQYTTSSIFHWKLALILLAAANALYFTVAAEAWALKAGEDAPVRAKFIAVSAVLLWIGVIYCGRMLPFIGNAF